MIRRMQVQDIHPFNFQTLQALSKLFPQILFRMAPLFLIFHHKRRNLCRDLKVRSGVRDGEEGLGEDLFGVAVAIDKGGVELGVGVGVEESQEGGYVLGASDADHGEGVWSVGLL